MEHKMTPQLTSHVMKWYRRAKSQPDVPTAYLITRHVAGTLRTVAVTVEDMDLQPSDEARIALIEGMTDAIRA